MVTQEETLEGNKLIAFSSFSEEDMRIWVNDIGNPSDNFTLNTLRYHKSYEMLMPVLQKIQKYAIIEITYSLVVTCRICYLGKNKYDKAINFYGDNNGGGEPIDAMWKCVVEFLKFYNENKL